MLSPGDDHLDPSAARAVLRRSQDRVLGQEGIPMVLALVDESGPPPVVPDPAVRAAGERLAAGMDAFRAALMPSTRDDDLGCVMSVLQAVSYQDFAFRDAQLPPASGPAPTRRPGP